MAEFPSEIEGIGSEFVLVVKRGPRAGMGWVLQEGTTTVGRHPESDIFLDDITVSRHHCRLVLDQEGLSVEDSGSTNGTYVNGMRVDRAALTAGDEVIVGKFHLSVGKGHE
jgi:pSer/pThr/pTyr-binding forkhead associated (FHA) protein